MTPPFGKQVKESQYFTIAAVLLLRISKTLQSFCLGLASTQDQPLVATMETLKAYAICPDAPGYEAFGYLKRVIVTPAVYPRLFEFHHFDIQSTGQKSHCVNTKLSPSQCFVLIKQSDSPGPYQF